MRFCSSAVVAAAAILFGCSAERRGVLPAGIATPIARERATAPGAPSPPGRAGFDLEAFTPWLSLPELKSAADALEAGDPGSAARQVEAFAAKRTSSNDAVSLSYLVARLREMASNFDGAAAAYRATATRSWPLVAYANLGAGRTLLRAGHPKEALEALGRVFSALPIGDDARLLTADASLALGDRAIPVATWRELLSRPSAEVDVVTLSLRLGETLLAQRGALPQGDPERAVAAKEAVSLGRRALVHAARPEQMKRATELETKALALLSPEERVALSNPTPDEQIERTKVLLDAKDFESASQVAVSLIASLGAGKGWSDTGCEAHVLEATALAGAHDIHRAESVAADAGRLCQDQELRARALFLAGRYETSEKRYAEAAQRYEELETECKKSKLADDARLKRALVSRELGMDARFTELLTRMPDDYPGGDMVLEGLFTLGVSRIEKGDWASALSVFERAASIAAPFDAERGREFAGRERYYIARAHGALAEVEKSLGEYEAIIRDLPLSYYTLHAYSRLERADPARAAKALRAALEGAARAPFAFVRRPEFDQPGFVRALELLRVGDVPSASREFAGLGFTEPSAAPAILWAVALLYERAGAPKLANSVMHGLSAAWVPRWPSGDWARAWRLAFPRPYHELVARQAKRTGVPESLVYAIMREESIFDPDAESPVHAYGLMQLIEPTARQYGKPLGILVTPAALERPSVNVTLGCSALSDLTRSFSKNPLLAIPGYNAGASRPRRWLRDHPAVDFDVWVELIPFRETRRYTKRVLASRATYAFLYGDVAPGDALRLPVSLTPKDAVRARPEKSATK